MEEKRNGRKLIAVCLLVLSLVLITVGTTFALFQHSRQGTTENTLHTGTLTFVYDEKRSEKNGVNLTNAFPMSDAKGQTLTSDADGVFDFEIRSTTRGAAINYEIYLTTENSTLPEYAVKTYLTKVTNTEGVENETPIPDKYNNEEINLYSKLGMSKVPNLGGKEGRTLYQGTVPDGKENYTETYRFRMWIDEEADKVVNGSWKYNGMTFSVRVNVYAQNGELQEPGKPAEYKDESGANSPELVEGLIPVRYDTNKKSWVKADLYKNWYDYDIQEWANAVTVSETMGVNGSHDRDYYVKAKAGEIIDIDDINTMWVWIPRYEYYISTDTKGELSTCHNSNYDPYDCYSNPGEIKINFISGESTETSDENYRVQPAFTFGENELTGIWYGKFETSNKEKTCNATTDNVVGIDCDLDTFTPEIKPNEAPWGGIRIATAFEVSRKMQTEKASVYGFKTYNVEGQNEYDTHMSKNSEWASVVYLSQSKYGKYGNDGQEVYINNCRPYVTGIAGDMANDTTSSETCKRNTYETEKGQKASTTGNITGVYDMSGGVWEYVMGVLVDEEGKPMSGYSTTSNSGFNGVLGRGGSLTDGKNFPEAKYYDLYTISDSPLPDSSAVVCNKENCIGHALLETAGWYEDVPWPVDPANPWFRRGGTPSMGSLAGVYSLQGIAGSAVSYHGFRLVLAPVES